MTGTSSPYDTDFLLWTREQAAILRSLPDGSTPLDVENLAEEIEGAGRAAVATMSSQIRRLLVVLISIALDPEADDAGSRVEEALRHQADAMAGRASGLDRHVDLDLIWRLARRQTLASYENGPEEDVAPSVNCPLTIERLLTGEFDPREVASTLSPPSSGASAPRP